MLRQRRLPGASVRVLSAREVAGLGLRANALICAVTSQRLEMPQGPVDSFRAGRAMVVQGDAMHAPAAIILHHRKHAVAKPPATAASTVASTATPSSPASPTGSGHA